MTIDRILVVIDGTPSGQRALEYSIELAQLVKSDLTALAVHDKLPAIPALVAEVQEQEKRRVGLVDVLVRLAQDEAAEHGLDLDVVRQHGTVEHAIVQQTSTGAFDLVVIGRGTRLSLSRLFGSRAGRLARRLPCPLLIAK